MTGTFSCRKSDFGHFLCFYLCMWLLQDTTAATNKCNNTACKGPIQYYHELHCKPIYEKPTDCCAISYDCSHLNERSIDKCYVNGNVYNLGDELKDEDRSNPCDVGCTCVKGFKDVATFTCAAIDCSVKKLKEGCYYRPKAGTCCEKEEICPKTLEDRIKCEFDGKTYLDGETFYPIKDRQLVCNCMEGYKGENIAPFCEYMSCGTELLRTLEIRDKCAPVFHNTQVPQTSCTYGYRCQNQNDTVLHPAANTSADTESKEPLNGISHDDMLCKFGNLTMQIGDELNEATDYSSICVKCVCDVPPTPTCQRLPDDVCDMSKHPPF